MDAISEALIKKYPDRKGLIEQSAKEAQFMDMLNGRFRDSGRVADSPGEYLDSVVGAPARTGIDEMQKGHFDLDALKKTLTSVGSDPKNAPTGVDLAYNTGIRNPYLGAAAATALDLGAQVPVGEIASLGKAMPGIMGKISDVAPALDMSREARLARAAEQGYDTSQPYYHGVPKPFEGDSFKPGTDNLIHFGSPEQANNRIEALTRHDDGEAVIPTYLKAKNPIELPDLGNFGAYSVASHLDKEGKLPPGFFSEIARSNDEQGSKLLKDYLKSQGHDSIKYTNTYEITPENLKYKYAAESKLQERQRTANEMFAKLRNVERGSEEHKALIGKIKEQTALVNDASAELEQIKNQIYQPSVAVFDPSQVRSVNAEFNPEKADSSNLLAAILGANPMQPGTGLVRARSSQKDNN
jgi:hypothetical protein